LDSEIETMFNVSAFNSLVEKSGLSDKQLAEKAGMSRQMIWLLRQGEATDVKLSTLQSLAAALDVEPTILIEEAA
jgi:DNA-binding Xre family transcriptional regulator